MWKNFKGVNTYARYGTCLILMSGMESNSTVLTLYTEENVPFVQGASCDSSHRKPKPSHRLKISAELVNKISLHCLHNSSYERACIPLSQKPKIYLQLLHF